MTARLTLVVLAVALAACAGSPGAAQEPHVLVFSKTAGYRHASIEPGIAAIRALGEEKGFAVDATEDAAVFEPDRLARHAAIVFLSTTLDVLDEKQQDAFAGYIRAGGGFVGIHAASDTEYDWPWYGRLVGGYFTSHPNDPNVREGTILVADADHVSTRMLPSPWVRQDEWYDLRDLAPDLNVLLNVQETSYKRPDENPAPEPRPIAWYHAYDGGRSWYTALGHTSESFSEPLFLAHVWGGLQYAMGDAAPGPETATTPAAGADSVLESTLEIIDVASGDRRAVYRVRGHIEAPNWSPDGGTLLYNSGGRIYTIPVEGGEPELLDTGFATRVNNDHGISPDGSTLIISDQSVDDGGSRIYTLPIEGGTPRLVTPRAPSYWHGVSPDGRTLAYVADRDGDYDIYTIPIEGGEETRLTTAPGLDDGPDYSPDGETLWFNSVRTGTMQIWRMRADGSDQEQVTDDAYNDWFPHPSPDGRWVVFLSYEPDVEGHPPNQPVMLRLIPSEGGEPRVLTRLFGGQGTINVPSWSPDSREVAFVSYRFVDP